MTERDLLSLAEESGEDWVSASTPPPVIPETPPTPIVEVESEPISQPEPEQGGGMGMVVILIILALGGAVGYYFKIYIPKQQQPDIEDDFDYENDYSDEDMGDDAPLWDVEDEGNKDDVE